MSHIKMGCAAVLLTLIPNTSAAVTSPWTGSVSTRSPIADNALKTVSSPIGIPGVVADAEAGFCWITELSGSFRGTNEFATIGEDQTGHFKAQVRSNTSYDSATGVGPAMSIKCRALTDFVTVTHVPDFEWDFAYAWGIASGLMGNYDQKSVDAKPGALFPWGGLEGRLGSAGGATWMISAMDHAGDTVFMRVPRSCPLASLASCKMSVQGWQIYSGIYTWTYSVTGSAASNNGNTTLVAASGQECYLDGVWGQWSSTSSAKVEVQADGNWHLVTAKGSGTLGMGAYASCFPVAQGF